jgi:hypothetical protein
MQIKRASKDVLLGRSPAVETLAVIQQWNVWRTSNLRSNRVKRQANFVVFVPFLNEMPIGLWKTAFAVYTQGQQALLLQHYSI